MPKTLPPLKSWRARPSQKLSKLLAVPKKVGVLRGSTRRSPWKPGIGSSALAVRRSGVTGWTVVGLAGTWTKAPLAVPPPGVGISVNGLKTTPIEEATSFVSLSTLAASQTVTAPETACGIPATPPTLATSFPTPPGTSAHSGSPAIWGLASLWNGKSLAARLYVLGAAPPWTWNVTSPPRWLGLTWFLVRLSAPAVKWQVPHDWTPSLPTCMSQNRDLPRAAATVRPSTEAPGPPMLHGYPASIVRSGVDPGPTT